MWRSLADGEVGVVVDLLCLAQEALGRGLDLGGGGVAGIDHDAGIAALVERITGEAAGESAQARSAARSRLSASAPYPSEASQSRWEQ